MSYYFRQLLINLTCRLSMPAGIFPTELRRKSEVLSLIGKLYPMATDTPLIRLGPADDGGYVIPDDLQGITACYSPGVSNICGFEWDCAQRGMRVYLADHSVDKPPIEHPHFHFTRKHIGVIDNDTYISLDSWINATAVDNRSDLLMQMDIEGCEYPALLNISETALRRFRILAIEFHHLDQLWNHVWFDVAQAVFTRILTTHVCVHIHPNNCCGMTRHRGVALPRVMEFTFLRKDRIVNPVPHAQYPHPLDQNNGPGPDLVLPEIWRPSDR